MIVVMLEPEGAYRCNDCVGDHGNGWIADEPQDHADKAHGGDHAMVVHPDDH